MSRSPSASSEGSKVTGASWDACSSSSSSSSDDPGEGPSHYHSYELDEDEPSSEDDYLICIKIKTTDGESQEKVKVQQSDGKDVKKHHSPGRVSVVQRTGNLLQTRSGPGASGPTGASGLEFNVFNTTRRKSRINPTQKTQINFCTGSTFTQRHIP
ncbi:uncharacterized protein V6R79_011910 [Siganus canaliculatus]